MERRRTDDRTPRRGDYRIRECHHIRRPIKFTPNKDLIQIIGKDIDEQYLDDIKTLSLSPEAIKKHADMKIVYSPIHGTGGMLIFDSLKKWGFENVIHVPEQDVRSGDFPTVVSPNPENAEAMSMAIAKAKETGASIVVASDPDSDRIGLVVRDGNGEYHRQRQPDRDDIPILSHHPQPRFSICSPSKEYCVKTIVTTETIKRIAEANGVTCYDCFT